MQREITSIRIDVPLRTTHAYLFLAPEDCVNEWWARLYEHLKALSGEELDWKFEGIQGKFVARPRLTERARSELANFLRSAPAALSSEHRTLRRAISLTREEERGLDVMFFSRVDTAPAPDIGS